MTTFPETSPSATHGDGRGILDILVVENHRHAADQAIAALQAAGHHVHRCFDADSAGYPCVAMHDVGACPINQGIDVVLAVRDRVEPRPTRFEVGVSCAVRASIPIAEQGPSALDPFEPWVTCRIDGDVVGGVETAADRGLDELRRSIISRLGTIVPSLVRDGAIHCGFTRDGHRLLVQLSGPEVGKAVENALAVRVLDAVWHTGRTFGQVDVSYRAVETVAG